MGENLNSFERNISAISDRYKCQAEKRAGVYPPAHVPFCAR